MNKLMVTTLILAAVSFSSAAEARHHGKHDYRVEPIDKPTESDVQYREINVGDPTIVYHEIGTAGAQKGNTIVHFYNEPIRSVRPYEVRYDYGVR